MHISCNYFKQPATVLYPFSPKKPLLGHTRLFASLSQAVVLMFHHNTPDAISNIPVPTYAHAHTHSPLLAHKAH